MKDGFIKVAAGTLHPAVADTKKNAEEICARIDEADVAGIQLLVLPELCITGYTCGDLFASRALQDAAKAALIQILHHSVGHYPVVVVGLPLLWSNRLYNVAAVLRDGKLLGVIPKSFIPGHGEFYEQRQFAAGNALPADATVTVDGQCVPFGSVLLFCHEELPDYCFGVEICEDVWVAETPSTVLCREGARLIANPSASNEAVGKAAYRRDLVNATATRLVCGYISCNAGPEESTQDVVFSRHHLLSETGTLLAENKPFAEASLTSTEMDVQRITAERQHLTTYPATEGNCRRVTFAQPLCHTALTRTVEKNPFVPADARELTKRIEEILPIQAYGLKKRLEHAHAATAVVGISGGLDSTLALLVTAQAMDLLGRSHEDIVAVTMPCFGTTNRTYQNACALCRELEVTLREVNIAAAVEQHFADIAHDPTKQDVTYENSQARERTQVLMDIANQHNGLVIGTGDLSELALGWATYNGDHMSMYGVNASVPKTLMRHMVAYIAQKTDNEALCRVLTDIMDTPVSPELLPAQEDGTIAQKTEELVGPYELHDFYLYYTVRFGFAPRKILRLAQYAMGDQYDEATLRHWLKTFLHRFFTQQFKRSCLPDGPKVGSVTLSPRGDWRMPSDALSSIWIADLEDEN